MPWARESTEFLDIQVQQVAGSIMLIAIVRLYWFEMGQSI